MSAGEVSELAKASLILLMVMTAPMLIASLVIGVAIGLLQALTQVQEMTLTFVPKLLVMGVVFIFSLPMIGKAMSNFMQTLASAIVSG
jgi:flagellar biosynthetic protein FliQ